MTNPYPSAAGDASYGVGPAVAPDEVQTAYKLYLTNVALGVLGAILSFVTLPSLIDITIAKQGNASGVSQEQLRSVIQVGVIVGIVIGLVLLALYVLFIFKMRAGRNWARIVLTVLSAISVISTLASFGTFGTLFSIGALGVVSVILSFVQLIILVVAVFFMFRPPSNAYFTASSRRV